MIEQIGCEGKDVRFVPCSTCMFSNDYKLCEKVRKDGNLKYLMREVE